MEKKKKPLIVMLTGYYVIILAAYLFLNYPGISYSFRMGNDLLGTSLLMIPFILAMLGLLLGGLKILELKDAGRRVVIYSSSYLLAFYFWAVLYRGSIKSIVFYVPIILGAPLVLLMLPHVKSYFTK